MVQIIDTHPHVVSPDLSRYPITPLGEKRSDWSHERSISTEELVAAMDEAGVAQAALVHSSTTYGFNCDYVADAVATYPDRFTGVFSVNVLAEDAAETMRAWKAKGLTGMRMYVKGTTVKAAWIKLDDERIFPCYRCAAENDITMAVNVAAADGFEPLEAVLKAFPDVRFFLDHAGRADYTDGPPFAAATPLLRLSSYPNLYLKVTSVNFLSMGKGWEDRAQSIIETLVANFGAERLAWGSNYPASKGRLTDLVALAKDQLSGLTDEQRAWIFHKTADRLYPSLAKSRLSVS